MNTFRPHILITGSNGMVGSYINRTQWHLPVIATIRENFDVTNLEQMEQFIKGKWVTEIVHMAAETDVDKCEKDPEHAYRVNTLGTQNVCYIARKLNVPLLYISTIGVFSGVANNVFDEFSSTSPANRYGKTKLAGEQIVKELLDRWWIVRAGWMMGGVQKDKKFVGKIIKQIQEGKKAIMALNDTFGSPTYAKELLQTIADLIQGEMYGTYHCTNEGIINRFGIANIICQELFSHIIVNECYQGQFTNKVFNLDAKRSYSESSNCFMLKERGLYNMSTIEDAMIEYLKEWKEVIDAKTIS